jgi:hypothetical protein
MTDVAAIGSVGPRTAPRTSAAPIPTAPIAAETARPTANIVATTRPTASVTIGTACARVSRGEVRNAAW